MVNSVSPSFDDSIYNDELRSPR